MIRHVVRAALLRRDPYLRMVLAPDGVADGLIVVGVTYLVLGGVWMWGQGLDVIDLVRFILGSLVGWIVISGLVYLIGKHLLGGYGSFPGVAAAAGLGHPPMLSALALSLVVSPLTALRVAAVWLLLCHWMAARVALELSEGRAALAAAGGYAGWLVVSFLLGF
jgi:hypothetical protein